MRSSCVVAFGWIKRERTRPDQQKLVTKEYLSTQLPKHHHHISLPPLPS